MFSKQFSNVKEHFLECFANILKSAKLFSEHVGIIQSTVICSIQNLTLFYRTILNVWQLFFWTFSVFYTEHSKMFSKQFLNVQEHFLKCSANILKSVKKIRTFWHLFRTLWFILEQILNLFYRTILNVWQTFFEIFWHFIWNTVNCSRTNLEFVFEIICNVWRIFFGNFLGKHFYGTL